MRDDQLSVEELVQSRGITERHARRLRQNRDWRAARRGGVPAPVVVSPRRDERPEEIVENHLRAFLKATVRALDGLDPITEAHQALLECSPEALVAALRSDDNAKLFLSACEARNAMTADYQKLIDSLIALDRSLVLTGCPYSKA